MRRLMIPILTVLIASGLLAGCGTNSVQIKQQNGAMSAALSITDTPPAGVTILAFEINVTGASLQPSDTTKPPFQLLNHPVEVELEELETETRFLNAANAPDGTYSSITLTFANPQLTILNQTGAPITAGSQSCSNGQICEFKPGLNQSSVTVSSAPFPLMLSHANPMGLVLDFNVDSSVQNNLTITPTVTLTATAAHAREVEGGDGENEFEDVEDVEGVVQTVGSNSFVLQSLESGQTSTINVDSNTQFEGFNEVGCAANNFSCLKAGQVVEVEDLHVMTTGAMVAGKIHLDEDVNEDQLKGKVVAVNAAMNQFQIVIHDEEPDVAGVNLGDPVTITINPGAAFSIQTDGLSGNLPAGAMFASVNDLLVGQEVKVRPVMVSAGPPVMVSTDHVALDLSQFTATVAGVSAPNFTVNNLPTLFTSNGITQVQVQTSSATEFEGVSGVSGLAAGNIVSLRGLLFKTAGDPILAAKKVRDRSAVSH